MLLRSFAFRLGVGFALVAVVGAAGTALAVNVAFAARFDHYLRQQQTAQLSQISTAISRSYVGQGRWNPTALATLAPVVGAGTVQVVSPDGQDVWHWDGHAMSGDDRRIQGSGPVRRRRGQWGPWRPTGDGAVDPA